MFISIWSFPCFCNCGPPLNEATLLIMNSDHCTGAILQTCLAHLQLSKACSTVSRSSPHCLHIGSPILVLLVIDSLTGKAWFKHFHKNIFTFCLRLSFHICVHVFLLFAFQLVLAFSRSSPCCSSFLFDRSLYPDLTE